MCKKIAFRCRLYKHYPIQIGVILLLGLSACANTTLKPSNTASSSISNTECEPPTQYAQRALGWTNSERSEELERLSDSLDSSDGYCSVLRLAIFLSTPSIGFQDDRKALLLLEKLSKDDRLIEPERDYVSRQLPHIEQRQNIRLLVDAQRTQIQQLNKLSE